MPATHPSPRSFGGTVNEGVGLPAPRGANQSIPSLQPGDWFRGEHVTHTEPIRVHLRDQLGCFERGEHPVLWVWCQDEVRLEILEAFLAMYIDSRPGSEPTGVQERRAECEREEGRKKE